MKDLSNASVLVVDDEEVIRDVLGTLLEVRGHYEVLLAADALEAQSALERNAVDLVLLDLFLPGTNGLDLLRTIKAGDPSREVIMMTAHGSVETAVEAMRAGAFHYLSKPFQNDEVLMLVETALTQRRLRLENASLHRALVERDGVGRLVGRSKAMLDVFAMIEQVAPSRSTVLITGESGTGKELTAEAIHERSGGEGRPFITVNSSNIPPDLLESHLFGHTRGSFTGATRDTKGLFEAAAGGTLFFDEISTIPPAVQAKLLRVMQEKEFLPLGAVRPVKVDVRILAATNESLEDLVKEGSFREDLFYRLNVLRVDLPPLRERREDIILLTEAFLREFSEESERSNLHLDEETIQLLYRYSWPGNVRQLRNAIERAVLVTQDDTVLVEALPEEIRKAGGEPASHPGLPAGLSFQDAVMEYERSLIQWALQECEGVQKRAAELLKMKATTLSERMKRLGIR